MLREPQHERKIIINIKFPPFVLSPVEGLPKIFSSLIEREVAILNPSAVTLRADLVKDLTKVNRTTAKHLHKHLPRLTACDEKTYSRHLKPQTTNQQF